MSSSSEQPKEAAAEEEEDRKPVIKPGVHITLKMQDTSGRSVYHTMRRAEKLQVLMDFYYTTVPALAYGTGRFLYDGGRLRGWQTPAELEMQDGDVVDFFTELIKLKVQDTSGRSVYHTMRRAEKLQVLMDFYYTTVPALAYGTGRFLYNGGRLRGWQTPAELEMQDGDEVDFFTELMIWEVGMRSSIAAAARRWP